MAPPLSSFVGQTLIWIPTAAFKARYDLIAPDNTTLATLDMNNWYTKANALVPEGNLFLRKEGWSGRKVVLSFGEQGPLLATYQRKWTGTSGELLFPDGRALRWNKTNFWGSQKAWIDPTSNTTYVQFSAGSFSRKSTVGILPQGAELPELSFLLVLGLYNILLERRDAAIASSTAATSSLSI